MLSNGISTIYITERGVRSLTAGEGDDHLCTVELRIVSARRWAVEAETQES